MNLKVRIAIVTARLNMTKKELAKELGVTTMAIETWIKRGYIPKVKNNEAFLRLEENANKSN